MADLAAERDEPIEKPPRVQLPIWAETERLIPNAMLRSALFSCARRRQFVDDVLIASWADVEIRFSGQTLNQFDESVWMQIIHLFRQQHEPVDFKVRFYAKPFCRMLGGKGGGGSNVAKLRQSLVRLRGGTLLISHNGMEYGGGVLNDFTHDEDRGFFVVTLNPKYLQLLSTGYTRVDWDTRKALPTGIATWMQLYVQSHRATKTSPHRIGLEQLHKLSGMGSSPKEFRRHLKRTMDLLKSHGVVESWRITDNGALEFIRPPARKRSPRS
jgi:hypothetical protein